VSSSHAYDVGRHATPAAAERACILLVDDHPASLLDMATILEPLGHELVQATSGEQALKQILRRNFALILMDLQMGGMSGFETAAFIKQHPRSQDVPIIFIGAKSHHAASVLPGHAPGAVDYLVKPLDPDILRSKAVMLIDFHARTERLKAEEQRLRQREHLARERQSEELYHRLIDSLPQCIWAASSDGQIKYWNRAGLDYFGAGAGGRDDLSLWDVIHPEDRDAARAQWELAVRGAAPFERQLRLKRASDGSYRWHLGRAVPEYDQTGTVVGWIATATDIHAQKMAEVALHDALAHRDDFLSVASHELRTPLTSLKLDLANLARLSQRGQAVPAERLAAKVAKIEGQTDRLHRLIDELLDVSRIVSGRLELHLEDVDLAALAVDYAQRLREEAARVGCPLNVRTEGPVVGRWDRARLDQVLANLVSNALKYGSGKPVEIAVTASAPAHHARLVVRDRGLGIAPPDQARIFERFERAASSRHFGGIGLGLWIVKQIVDALGGTVAVESQLGAGSTFTVELPIAESTAAPN
jgi:PAS domain S-box-containing protein